MLLYEEAGDSQPCQEALKYLQNSYAIISQKGDAVGSKCKLSVVNNKFIFVYQSRRKSGSVHVVIVLIVNVHIINNKTHPCR